jgi:hypothetical protein
MRAGKPLGTRNIKTENNMKTKLQLQLATIAPSISIQTFWSHDNDSGPISKECDGFDPSEDDEWQCWQCEIKATVIVEGNEVSGSAYLGGTWEKYGEHPSSSNPEISGYEPQMTEEALDDLRVYCGAPIIKQIDKAIRLIKREMSASYKAQMQPA